MAESFAFEWRSNRPVWLFVLLVAGIDGCGASEKERLQQQVLAVQGDLQRSEQHVADMKVHVGTLRAQNKVLIGLVQGLTAETDASSAEGTGAAQQALVTLDEDIHLLATTLKKSREELLALRSQRQQLQTNLGEAMRTIQDAKQREAQAQHRFELFHAMLMRLKSAIESEQLQLQVVRNQMVVQLPEALLFESGRAEIVAEGRSLLDSVASALRQIDGREFQVAGHTDNAPLRNSKFRSNWDLSGARAITVARYLINHGMAAERLSAAAFGDTRPVQANDTEEQRSANRRIEIVLLPKLDELPDLSVLEETRPEAAAREPGSGLPTSATPAPASAAPTTSSPASSSPRGVRGGLDI
jgi:chemotaxis protein MotB